MNKATFSNIAILLANLIITTAANMGEGQGRAPTFAELGNASYVGIEQEQSRLSSDNREGEPYLEGAVSLPRVGLLEDVYI